jgi:hypothetical protein
MSKAAELEMWTRFPVPVLNPRGSSSSHRIAGIVRYHHGALLRYWSTVQTNTEGQVGGIRAENDFELLRERVHRGKNAQRAMINGISVA